MAGIGIIQKQEGDRENEENFRWFQPSMEQNNARQRAQNRNARRKQFRIPGCGHQTAMLPEKEQCPSSWVTRNRVFQFLPCAPYKIERNRHD
jgi:hypothetical protein